MTRSGVLLGLVLALAGAGAAQPASTLIVNATVVDGTGGPQRQVAVRISGDRMTNVGTLEPPPGEHVVDAKGLILAPEFIDTHSHHDRGMFEAPQSQDSVTDLMHQHDVRGGGR